MVLEHITLARAIKFLLALIALFLGGMIYITYRSKSLIMFSWFEALGLSPTMEAIRLDFGDRSIYGWIRDCFPAGLWLFSYLLFIDCIWNKQTHRVCSTFIIALPTIAILSEILQGLHVLPGTYDIMDVVSYFIAIILFIIIKIIDK